MTKKARLIVLGGMLALAFIVASAVVAAQLGGGPGPDAVAMERAIEAAPLIGVAEIEATADSPRRGVYVQRTANGYVCVWDAPSASSQRRQGGCNRAEDPLGGGPISASLAYDGGPSIESVGDARLTGLASAETASVLVLMSDGTPRRVKLENAKIGSEEFRAFGYRFRKADLKKGIGPTAIVAYDADGNEIGRQPTGIG